MKSISIPSKNVRLLPPGEPAIIAYKYIDVFLLQTVANGVVWYLMKLCQLASSLIVKVSKLRQIFHRRVSLFSYHLLQFISVAFFLFLFLSFREMLEQKLITGFFPITTQHRIFLTDTLMLILLLLEIMNIFLVFPFSPSGYRKGTHIYNRQNRWCPSVPEPEQCECRNFLLQVERDECLSCR